MRRSTLLCVVLSCAFLLLAPACGGDGGGGGGGPADTTAPIFTGAQSIATAGGAAVRLDWQAALDETTATAALVYDIFISATAGGQNFAAPFFTTAPGATSAVVTSANSGLIAVGSAPFFVVRARDGAGNRDTNTVEVSVPLVAASAVAYVSDTAGGTGTLGDPSDPFPTISDGVTAAEGNGGGIVLVDADPAGTTYNEEVDLTANVSSMALYGGFPRFSTLPPAPSGAAVLATRNIAGNRTIISGAGLLPFADNDLVRVANMGTPTTIDGFDITVPGRLVPLTGTLTFTQGDDQVSGTGTAFETELREGDLIQLDADGIPMIISEIQSDTQIRLSPDDGGNGQGYQGAGGTGPGSLVTHDAGVGGIDMDVQISSNRFLNGAPIESDTTTITDTSSLRVVGNSFDGLARDCVRLGGGVSVFHFLNNTTDIRSRGLQTIFSASGAINVPTAGTEICICDNLLQSRGNDFDFEQWWSTLSFAPAVAASGGALNIIFERNEMRAIEGGGFELMNWGQVGENGSASLTIRHNLINGVNRAPFLISTFLVDITTFPVPVTGDPLPGVTQSIVAHDNVFLNTNNRYIDAYLSVSANSTTDVTVYDNFFSVSESELTRIQGLGGETDGTSDEGAITVDHFRNVHYSGGEEFSARSGAAHGGTTTMNFYENTITGTEEPCIQAEFNANVGTTAAVFPAPNGVVCINVFNNFMRGNDDEGFEYRARNTNPDQICMLYVGHNLAHNGSDGSDGAIELRNISFDNETTFNTYAFIERNATGIGGQDSSECGIEFETGGSEDWSHGGRLWAQNNIALLSSGAGIEWRDRGSQPQIVNNTVAYNGQALESGFDARYVNGFLDNGEPQAFVTNCIAAFSGGSDVDAASGVRPSYTLARDGTAVGFGNLTGNPFFDNDIDLLDVTGGPVDPLATMFTLLPTSPAVDAGDPASHFNDTDGTRNDMGAYGGPGAGVLSIKPAGTPNPVAYMGIFPAPYMYSGAELPADTSTISLLFNRPIDPSTITAGISITNDGVAVPGTLTVVDGCTVRFVPTGSLTPGASPFVDIAVTTSLEDTSGTALSFDTVDRFAVAQTAAAEAEPNDDVTPGISLADLAAAQATGAGPGSSVFGVTGTISSNTDEDVYSFTVSAGDRLMATVLDSRMGGGEDGDIHLDLYDAAGNRIVEGLRGAFNPDYATEGDPYLDHVFATGGTFYLVITNPDTAAPPQSYELVGVID